MSKSSEALIFPMADDPKDADKRPNADADAPAASSGRIHFPNKEEMDEKIKKLREMHRHNVAASRASRDKPMTADHAAAGPGEVLAWFKAWPAASTKSR